MGQRTSHQKVSSFITPVLPEDAISGLSSKVRKAFNEGRLYEKRGPIPREADVATRRDREFPYSERSYRFSDIEDELVDEITAIEAAITKEFPNYTPALTALHYYSKGSHMGWHTNSNAPALRAYVVWGEGERGMQFVVDGETIDSPESNTSPIVRLFTVPPLPEKLWHRVYCEGERFSVGFRLYPKET